MPGGVLSEAALFHFLKNMAIIGGLMALGGGNTNAGKKRKSTLRYKTE